jgi:hypothetical protein
MFFPPWLQWWSTPTLDTKERAGDIQHECWDLI